MKTLSKRLEEKFLTLRKQGIAPSRLILNPLDWQFMLEAIEAGRRYQVLTYLGGKIPHAYFYESIRIEKGFFTRFIV